MQFGFQALAMSADLHQVGALLLVPLFHNWLSLKLMSSCSWKQMDQIPWMQPAPTDRFSVQRFINKMHSSGWLQHRIFTSYGAMCSIFPFMRPMKVLFLQRLNRFMYHRGVERSQPRFPLGPPVIYFTYPDSRKWDRTLFLYSLKMQKVMRPIKLPK